MFYFLFEHFPLLFLKRRSLQSKNGHDPQAFLNLLPFLQNPIIFTRVVIVEKNHVTGCFFLMEQVYVDFHFLNNVVFNMPALFYCSVCLFLFNSMYLTHCIDFQSMSSFLMMVQVIFFHAWYYRSLIIQKESDLQSTTL